MQLRGSVKALMPATSMQSASQIRLFGAVVSILTAFSCFGKVVSQNLSHLPNLLSQQSVQSAWRWLMTACNAARIQSAL